MNIETLATATIGWSSVALILYIWRVLYPATRIEQFRQAVFALRARMFDDAADGKLSFTDAPYIVLNTTMNGFLKDAESVTLLEVITITRNIQRHSHIFKPPAILDKSLDSVNSELQKIYREYSQALHHEVVLFLFKRSILVYVILLTAMRIARAKGKAMSRLDTAGRAAEIHAYKIGRMQFA